MSQLPFETAPIFSHITLGVTNLERSIAFYDAVFATLSLVRHSTASMFAGYGQPPDAALGCNSVWIVLPRNGQPANAGNGTNIALLAKSREAVQAFHVAALKHGGSSDGSPGVRTEAHPNFYAAYILDPDGNKLVAVCHGEPSAA